VRLRWSVAAITDLDELRTYIAADNPPAAGRTVRRIRAAALRIQEFPFSGAPASIEELRQSHVPATPFRIIYRIETDVVLIVAIRHGARQWPPSA